MGIFSKQFSQGPAESGPPEQAFIVTLKLSDDEFGTEDEGDRIFELSERMIRAIEQARAGEFDGNEFGGGQCTLFMYGPDADALCAAVDPILRESPLAQGAVAVKRYGDAADRNAPETRIQY
jgi:hypothetical protein